MNITGIDLMPAIRSEPNGIRKTEGETFYDFLSAAEKTANGREEADAPESCKKSEPEKAETEEFLEPHPCYKCGKREECELRKKIEEGKEQPSSAGYFPRKHTDHYERIFVLSRVIEPVREDRSLADYLNFFYNNISPYEPQDE